MNCNEFCERLQRRLDDRVRPEGDRDLVRHAQQCPDCRGQLETWGRVSSLLPTTPATVRPALRTDASSRRPVAWAASGLAAAAMIFIVLNMDHQGTSKSSSDRIQAAAASDQASEGSGLLAATELNMDPVGWWQDVQDRDWVSQTMPTVRSMQAGVAPLRRTLVRAMTILTTGGRDHTS